MKQLFFSKFLFLIVVILVTGGLFLSFGSIELFAQTYPTSTPIPTSAPTDCATICRAHCSTPCASDCTNGACTWYQGATECVCDRNCTGTCPTTCSNPGPGCYCEEYAGPACSYCGNSGTCKRLKCGGTPTTVPPTTVPPTTGPTITGGPTITPVITPTITPIISGPTTVPPTKAPPTAIPTEPGCDPVNGVCTRYNCSAPLCGQIVPGACEGAYCGGTCPSCGLTTCSVNDCGDPGSPTNPFPGNPQADPYLASTDTITLTWNNPVDGKGFNYFPIRVWDMTAHSTFSCATDLCDNTVPNTVHSFTYPKTGKLIGGHLYRWWVDAYDPDNCNGIGSCPSDDGWSPDIKVGGYFVVNPPPKYKEITLQNSSNSSVPSESYGVGLQRNHICDIKFMKNGAHDRKVNFRVTVTDPDGGNTIDEVKLRFVKTGASFEVGALGLTTTLSTTIGGNASFWSNVTYSVGGTAVTVNFPIQFADSFVSGMYRMEVYAKDTVGAIIDVPSGYFDSKYDFKVWDCLVPVDGSVYDGTLGSLCSTGLGYVDLIPGTISYNLSYKLGGLSPRIMTVVSPSYASNGQSLVWGTNYFSDFTNLPGSIPSEMKILDKGTGSRGCDTSLDTAEWVDPYSSNPALQVDYSTTLNQDPWFQIIGGGVNALYKISDAIPATCVGTEGCKAAISAENPELGGANNGIIIGKEINKGCDTCRYGDPNDWSSEVNRASLGDNYSYSYFMSAYGDQGKVYNQSTNMTTIKNDVGGVGVVFVNGDLTIDVDNTITPGNILVLIVKGNITINQEVSKTEGVLVADGKILVGGNSSNQLEINGILYSGTQDIKLNRSYEPKNTNNTSPAIKVNYKPEFVFMLPAKLTQTMSGWKEGN